MSATAERSTTYPRIPVGLATEVPLFDLTVTGALQAQPSGEAVNLLTCCDFTPDFKTFFDMRGALDAPEQIPSGGVRAQEFLPPGTPGRLLIAHVYRPGALEYRA